MKISLSEGFQETKKHGSTLFPFNIYPCTIPSDFPAVSLHWQQSMELIYIKKGHGIVQIGLDIYEAAQGDIFVVTPGTLHALRGLTGYTMEYENMIFDVAFLGAGAADICAQEYLVPLAAGQLKLPALLRHGMTAYEQANDCLRDTEELCKEKLPGYELGVKASMLRFLFLLLRMYPENRSTPPDMLRLHTILQHIESNYSQSLSITQAAKLCSLSESHFMRWFKQMTGSSFTSYLNERRLAAAAEALRQTDDTILVIAENVGFENLSNFNRQFKARYGITPRQYRN